MKRIVALVCIGWMVVGGAVGAATVVSTHTVLGEFAQIVGGEGIEVETIIPAGFCPAQYDLSPRDLTAVLDASLILYTGFEPWIETLSASGAPVEPPERQSSAISVLVMSRSSAPTSSMLTSPMSAPSSSTTGRMFNFDSERTSAA